MEWTELDSELTKNYNKNKYYNKKISALTKATAVKRIAFEFYANISADRPWRRSQRPATRRTSRAVQMTGAADNQSVLRDQVLFVGGGGADSSIGCR